MLDLGVIFVAMSRVFMMLVSRRSAPASAARRHIQLLITYTVLMAAPCWCELRPDHAAVEPMLAAIPAVVVALIIGGRSRS